MNKLENCREALKNIEDLLLNLIKYRSKYKQNLSNYTNKKIFKYLKKNEEIDRQFDENYNLEYIDFITDKNKDYENKINNQIIKYYFEELIPNLCDKGEDKYIFYTLKLDYDILKLISRRIYLCYYVVVNKYKNNKEEYDNIMNNYELILKNHEVYTKIYNKITNKTVEKNILERLKKK